MATTTLNPAVPPNQGESPGNGAARIRALTQAFLDLFNLRANVALPPVTTTRIGPLTNRVGNAILLGHVVTVDPANDTSVIADDTAGSTRPFVVALEGLDNGATGTFGGSGQATVITVGVVTRGHYLRKAASSSAVEDTGVASSANPPPVGSLGVALTATASVGTSSVQAILFGFTASSAGLSAAISAGASGASNTASLQAQINAAPAGTLLEIAGGTFVLASTVTINKRLTLRGAGRASTILAFSAGGLAVLTNDAVTVADMTITTPGTVALSIDGLSGIGNGDSQVINVRATASGGDAIYVSGGYNTQIVGCQAFGLGASGSGIRLHNHFSADSGNYLVQGCIPLYGKFAGIRHDSGAGLNILGNTIFDPAFANQYGIYLGGVFVVGAAETLIANNDIACSTAAGFWVDSVLGYQGLQFNGNNIRGDQGAGGGVTVTNGSASALMMTGNTIGAGANKAIVVDLGANGITITGNHFQHTQAGKVAINFRSAAANGMVSGNMYYANISFTSPVTTHASATFIELHDGSYSFAGLPAVATVRKGSRVYVDDGTPGTLPLTGGGGGAVAVYQAAQWRGL